MNDERYLNVVKYGPSENYGILGDDLLFGSSVNPLILGIEVIAKHMTIEEARALIKLLEE